MGRRSLAGQRRLGRFHLVRNALGKDAAGVDIVRFDGDQIGLRDPTREQVLADLDKRERASADFIRPQKACADMVVRFQPPPKEADDAHLGTKPTLYRI